MLQVHRGCARQHLVPLTMCTIEVRCAGRSGVAAAMNLMIPLQLAWPTCRPAVVMSTALNGWYSGRVPATPAPGFTVDQSPTQSASGDACSPPLINSAGAPCGEGKHH